MFFIRTKSTKSTKRKQATFTQTFYMCRKNMKSTKSNLHSDLFYAHKKHEKHKKHKKHKTSNKQFSSSQMFFMRIKMLSFTHIKGQKAQKVHKKHKNVNKRLSSPQFFLSASKTLPFLFLFAYMRFCAFYVCEIFS